MMTQFSPPIPIKTPKGDGWAVALIDYGPQWDLLWVTFIKGTGECWTFRNPEIRQGANYTFNTPEPTAIKHMEIKSDASFKSNGHSLKGNGHEDKEWEEKGIKGNN